MGYPFNKVWKSRANSTASIREIVKDLPHAIMSDFTIHRYTKQYGGCTSYNNYSSDVTWEKMIRNFFTKGDIRCMLAWFNLGNKESVAVNAGVIYEVVKKGYMPPGNPWNTTLVMKFRQWMCAGFP